MGIPLRTLIIEDSEDDALLVVRTLRKGGYDPAYERVETADAMGEALALPITQERINSDMAEAGFAHIYGTTHRITVVYASVNELVRAIKGMGARNASTHRNRSAGVRRVWRRMTELYEHEFGASEGVPATFEIIMARGRKSR